MFEGAFSPPVYNELYNFIDGPQDDIFEDSYISLPDPAPNAPLPVLRNVTGQGQGPSTATPMQSLTGNQTRTNFFKCYADRVCKHTVLVRYPHTLLTYSLMLVIANVRHLPGCTREISQISAPRENGTTTCQ